jgi:Tol biopolymer transport system component
VNRTLARMAARRAGVTVALVALAIAVVAPAASAGPKTVLVSRDDGGAQAPSFSSDPSINADGKIAAFVNRSKLQAPPDADALSDAYFRGIPAKNTRIVSRSTAGVVGNSGVSSPVVSDNGRYITYRSTATNLIDGKVLSGEGAIFLFDRIKKKTTLISVNNAGVQANGDCRLPDISAGGKLVLFECFGGVSNLTSKNTHGVMQVYLRNLNTKKTILISQNNSGKAGTGDSFQGSISPDGRYVAFRTEAGNMPGTKNGLQVVLRDWKSKWSRLVSRNGKGKPGNHDSLQPDVSEKARVIVFESDATNLGAKDTNGVQDIYRHRRLAGKKGKTDRASKNWRNRQLGGGNPQGADYPSISRDGRYLVFTSPSKNAIKGGVPGGSNIQVYRRDLAKGALKLVSRTGGAVANGDTRQVQISGNGKYVILMSEATNLVPGGDLNGSDEDILRRGPY